MYIAFDVPNGKTNVVCEEYVLLPAAANVFQEDQGPAREVAYEYT